MAKLKRAIVYDFIGKPPEDAIDGAEEILSDETRAEKQSADTVYLGLFAGRLDGSAGDKR